jgi:hypothetical protein
VALPTAYLTSLRNVQAIFAAVQAAQAPPRFTQKFLESLGFPNTNDRSFINVLKALGFLTDTGIPTQRYHEFLDQTQSAQVLARGIREAYADLFQINTQAHRMSQSDVKNKMKTLSAGQFTDRVLLEMSKTFAALCNIADFSTSTPANAVELVADPASSAMPVSPAIRAVAPQVTATVEYPNFPRIGGLVYSINVQLPESRDQAVYDAIFKSMREHLL